MQVQEKDTVYAQADLGNLEVAELQEILNMRNIAYHHKSGAGSLIDKIMESNPSAPMADIVPETKEIISKGIAPVMDENKGIVKLEIIASKKTGSLRVRDYTSPEGDKMQLRDKNGDPWVYMITKNVKLNMAVKEDRALYEHLKKHPYVLGGSGLVPSIKLINEGADSIENVLSVENAIKAQNVIMGLDEQELRDFARVINVTVAHKSSAVVVKSKCYELCKTKPEFVLEMWNDSHRGLRSILYKAQDQGLITKIEGVLKFDKISVGTTFEEMVLWFDKNPDILPGLRNKLN